MDLSTLTQRFVVAKRMTYELLHRLAIARTAHSQLCVDQAIRRAQGQTISTYELLTLRTLSHASKNWRHLALAQVDCLRQARRSLLMARGNLPERRKALDRRARG